MRWQILLLEAEQVLLFLLDKIAVPLINVLVPRDFNSELFRAFRYSWSKSALLNVRSRFFFPLLVNKLVFSCLPVSCVLKEVINLPTAESELK